MKKRLEHLPKDKTDELTNVVSIICRECDDVEMILLFGSYARGDWKDGPHEQGRGRLTIHKKSDYDILVITASEYVARNVNLWHKVKDECSQQVLSAYVRVIARDMKFVNEKLRQGQYFFTEIVQEGIPLYDKGNAQFTARQELDPAEAKRIALTVLDETFTASKEAYDLYKSAQGKAQFKWAAFMLHQATEHSYKTVLLIFSGECPQEHHLDILGDLAADYCPELTNILPRETAEQKHLFELLDYAYIGARYDHHYKITKSQLEQLSPSVKELLVTTETTCKAKIKSLTNQQE